MGEMISSFHPLGRQDQAVCAVLPPPQGLCPRPVQWARCRPGSRSGVWRARRRSPRAAMPPFGLPQNNILRRAVSSRQRPSRRDISAAGKSGAPRPHPEAARRGRSSREVPCQSSAGSSAATGSSLGKDSETVPAAGAGSRPAGRGVRAKFSGDSSSPAGEGNETN